MNTLTKISRQKIEDVIYQSLIQSSELQAYLAPIIVSYGRWTIKDFVAKSGLSLSTSEVVFPAIRYRIQGERPDRREGLAVEKRVVTFDIFIDTRVDDNDQSNDLLEIIRDIFTSNMGRDIGTFSQSTAFLTVCPESTLDVQRIDETFVDQRSSMDESGTLPMKAPPERTVFAIIRFDMVVMDLNVYPT